MKRILRPLIGLVLAVAVAISAAVIGIRFATPETVTTNPGVITAPVLAPSAVGDEQPDVNGQTSEAVSERQVTLPGSAVEGVAPAARVVLDEMSGASDPLETLSVLMEEAAAEAPPTDGDPCAPRDGEPPADCPDGLESTVLSVVTPQELSVGGQAFPPTWERFLAEGNPYAGSLWCDGLVVGEGDVPFGVLATAPGTATITYWPTADPTDITTAPAVSATPAEIAAYETALAAATRAIEVQNPRLCTVLPGLPAGTDYSARVLYADTFGRIASSSIVRFNTDGAPTRPGAQIAVLGDNFVFASGLRTRYETIDARAWIFDDVATANCAGTGSRWQITPATQAESRVDQDFLSSINAPPAYTEKSVFTYRVPEGSTIIVCLRWFPAGDAPSWEREQHDYQSEVVLQSPDIILPVVTMVDFAFVGDAAVSVRTNASTTEGGSCPYYPTYRAGQEISLPAILCDDRSFVEGGVRVDDDRIYDLGFSGDVLISNLIELAGDREATRGWVLPLSRQLCRGVCELPKPSHYTLGGTIGIAEHSRSVIRVDWIQGQQNGLTDWNVLPSTQGEVGYVTPDLPQLDTAAEVTVGMDERTLLAHANLTFEVDRPVTYTVHLRSRYGSEPCMQTPSLGTTRTGSASTLGAASVRFDGLCLGTGYDISVELTDVATGATALWGATDRSTWWVGGLVETPGLDVTISYDWLAQGYARSNVSNVSLLIDFVDLEAVNGRGGSCTDDGIASGSDSGIETSLSSTPWVRFTATIRPSDRYTPTACYERLRDGFETDIGVSVSLRDLLRPEGVIIEVPEGNSRVHLWAYRVA